MKFLCTADWHTRRNNPKYRIDDYLQTQLQKINFLVEFANKRNATMLIAGDIFDSPKAGYYVTNLVSKELRGLINPTIAAPGNHDTTFHSKDMSNTPFDNLMVNGNISPIGTYADANAHVQTMGWECECPEPRKGMINILVAHVSVFEKDVPFWCPNGITAKQAEKKFAGFDYCVFGDIHIPFDTKKIINPGSLSRMNMSQVDYQPVAYLLDTETGEIEQVKIPIEKSSKVFNFDQADIDVMKNTAALNDCINMMKYEGDKPNFLKVLDEVVKKAKASPAVILLLNEILEEV